MNERRQQKFLHAAQRSQLDLTVILENITDPLNIGAILRTCDSVGIREIFVVNSSEDRDAQMLRIGKRSSMGTRKWVDVHYFNSIEACIQAVRVKYNTIVGTAFSDASTTIFQTDFTRSVAIMLGNEKDGLSAKAIKCCNRLVIIPQVGLAESLNVSVAAAVILYEAYRQREAAGKYEPASDTQTAEVYEKFLDKIQDQTKNTKRYKILPSDGFE